MQNKKYYRIVLETMIPATLHFRVLAENEEEALSLIEKNKEAPKNIKYSHNKKRNIKITAYDDFSVSVRKVKYYK